MAKHLPELGRFSDPALLILSSLAGSPKHGYAMIEDIEEFSGTHLEPLLRSFLIPAAEPLPTPARV